MMKRTGGLSCAVSLVVAALVGAACSSGGDSCTAHASTVCRDDVVYWQDSCGNRQEQKQACDCGCNVAGSDCEPCTCERDCTDLDCGPDPVCGESCGDCLTGEECIAGTCEPICAPDCTGLNCGPDPVCGESCGDCTGGQVCARGTCMAPSTNTCATPAALACAATVSGDTAVALDGINEYDCVEWEVDGGEDVYALTVAEVAGVTIHLTGLEDDLDLVVLEGACEGAACKTASLGYEDEEVTFNANPGTTYYVVVDGYADYPSVYQLSVVCGPPCVPDCSATACGPDPVCGESCGDCGADLVCDGGQCVPNPCTAMPYEGCCDGAVVKWCEDDEFYRADCAANDPPLDCGWSEEFGFFDCGGEDTPPTGVDPTCP